MSNSGGATLSEAIASGEGVERPFRCTEHEDNMASATVNMNLMVWYCHACQANGSVGSKKAPSIGDLEIMIRPEISCRVYPEAFLELYAQPRYWLSRFPDWLCWSMGLGEDPFTGDATFPVHTPEGRLAGVGRRKADGQPKYLYPKNWSSGSTLFGTASRYQRYDIICLGEGAADAVAMWEVGCPGLAVYGSGLHFQQRELLARYAPKLILLGFDMDPAGQQGDDRAVALINRLAPTQRVYWPEKDPGESSPSQRLEVLLDAVSRAGYVVDVLPNWEHNVAAKKALYQEHLKEER